jgi:multidrug efflux pump
MTLSVAIMISLAVSLTTTPMMCAYLLADRREQAHGRLYWASERAFTGILSLYDRSLRRALQWPSLVMLSLLATLCLGIYLVKIVPKGFFPTQDIGLMFGGIQADQSISFQLMEQKLTRFVDIIRHDPAVQSVSAFTGGGQTNSGFVFVVLKPLSVRKVPMPQVMARLRPKFNEVAGARLFLQGAQDIRAGGRANNAQYQYTLQGDDANEIYEWAPKLEAALQKLPLLTDVNLDQQQKGLETDLVIDRETAARFGLTVSQIDNTLYDAFGQRQVSTIYAAQNQYHVIMEVAPEYWQNPDTLSQIYVSTSGGAVGGTKATNALAGTVLAKVPPANSAGAQTTTAQIASDTARNLANNALANTGRAATSTGAPVSTSHETMVPLSAFAHFGTGNTPLAVNHQNLFVASTISFNLAPDVSLSQATAAIDDQMRQLGVPASIHGSFQGTAAVFQQSLNNEPLLVAAALLAVYIVLGVILTNTEFSIMALIGVILLIGIVKKNAIMMIDFALDAERTLGLSSREAIYQACLKRFRPIMMTTMAAMLGALPLAIGFGEGSELRRPLGISIVGGLIVSQLLTLYTTPVIYLYLDRLRLWGGRRWRIRHPRFYSGRVPEPGE